MSSFKSNQRYVGIDKEENEGMTVTGKIVRDAWVFGIIPETETCEGWMMQGMEDLWLKVNAEWEKYGFQVNGLPDDLRERFMRIHNEAFERAKNAGWSPELDDDD